MKRTPPDATPSSSAASLPQTLALRVQHLREAMDMTQRQLANKSFIDLVQIQDIESGVELFLAPAIRLKLARALRVRPDVLEAVETRPKTTGALSETQQWQAERRLRELLERIVDRPEEAYTCLSCDAPLLVRTFTRRDLDDRPLTTVKIQCTQCLFQWATD